MAGKLIWVYICGENEYQVLLGCDVVYLVVLNNTLFHVEGRRRSMFVRNRFTFLRNYTASRPSNAWISCSTAESTYDLAR